jgi:hypothetical protein
MAKEDRKCKMISLRITAGEYDALHTLYRSYGARNVSDLARLALQHVLGKALSTDDGALHTKVHDMDERLRVVEEAIALLAEQDRQTA